MAARTTFCTPAVRRHIPCCHVVMVAADQHGAAFVTMGGLADGIVDIASVDVPDACMLGDLPRHLQRLRWCSRGTHQLPLRMESREV